MRISGTFWLAAICLLLPFAAWSGESNLPPGLQQFVLSDEEIAARCEASIQAKVGLEQTDDGRWLTRCERHYDAMRSVAQRISARIHDASLRVQKHAKRCSENNTQTNCLEAGKRLANSTADAYAQAAQDVDEGIQEVANVGSGPRGND